MVILGLTGSIGMGKSTAAAALRRLGLAVHDSDAVVHALYAPGGAAVDEIAAAFPGVVREDGSVDRAALSRRVIGDPAAIARLEAIVHPLVGEARDRFLRAMAARREPIVVLDIPLMFEAGLDRLCDAVIVVSAPRFLQKARVMSRPGMTSDRLTAILGQQMPDAEKRRRADFVVPTGSGRRASLRRLAEIVRVMRRRPARRTHARSRP